jgi:hypothetical protein
MQGFLHKESRKERRRERSGRNTDEEERKRRKIQGIECLSSDLSRLMQRRKSAIVSDKS